MKKYIFSGIAALMALTSCQDFLTEYPGNKITPDDFFKNEREINLYANSFYQRDMPGTGIATGDAISDITAVVSVNKYLTSGFSPADQGGWSWSDLRNINFFIDRVKVSPVSEEIKNKYLGLAKFWRAKFYFEKVKTFGGVPYYDYCLSENDPALYKGRDTREFVMEQVLADINDAVKYCDDQKDESLTYVTRYVALAMKARICLHEGTFRKYHSEMNLPDAEKWLREAASAAYEIMESGKYRLRTGAPDTDYRTLFTSEGISGSRNLVDEVIWAQIYDAEFRRWHDITWKYNSTTTGDRWSLNRAFVNTYLMLDGSRFTDQPDYNKVIFSKEVKNRDLRLKQTIRTPGYYRSNGDKALPDYTVTLTGYHIFKWSLDNPMYDGKGEGTNCIPIFRYAEVLLIYAEAMAELGEFNSSVWNKTIKLLRERAGVNGKEPLTADTYLQDTFYPEISDKYLLEIRRERAIELIAENFRYDDLMRWKKADLLTEAVLPWTGVYIPELGKGYDLDADGKSDVCFYKGKKPSISGVVFIPINESLTLTEGTKGNLQWGKGWERQWDDKKYLRPIPRNVRVLNPNLQQNPGWGE